ncbi:D-fructose 1,6-bisphosphatase [Tistlia consotensis]|uniref:Fructose-1,6-bisphosphatase class 1 n=1 Tax=Tistlia consotensis USBA 355 TaxID=560819 RepID=A0A1Y6CB89_9PROT|nr:class 1 fructose-bisphosphatase [Tistlia consotensis]SMF55293.1 D-fructose 1,6-bisphosphatase [Tistlia consotensis USBA 355]SNR88121.1 D-fructose 1,6-bisphosphatase [Tistlia consotensis]
MSDPATNPATDPATLAQYLAGWSGDDPLRRAVAETVEVLGQAIVEIAERLGRGELDGPLGGAVGRNADGDSQATLDLQAHELVLAALAGAPVAWLGSEESESPIALRPDAPLAVAIDPLDGSSNLDTDVSVGTIFSILPALPAATPTALGGAARHPLLQPGSSQLAAGFVVYGPHTALAVTLGAGTQVFTLDRAARTFRRTRRDLAIPLGRREYAINASNYRFWDPAIQSYIDDCIAGAEGPRGENFNMRWIASLVAEAYRVLQRGGIFLYPRDARPGYGEGRLRLVYEANPIAFIVEQAGGAATDGVSPIRSIEPHALHQRTPLVFGSRDKVERVARYHSDPPGLGEASPLFGRRGLFRA